MWLKSTLEVGQLQASLSTMEGEVIVQEDSLTGSLLWGRSASGR